MREILQYWRQRKLMYRESLSRQIYQCLFYFAKIEAAKFEIIAKREIFRRQKSWFTVHNTL